MEAAAATRDESRPTLVEAAAIAVVISTALNALGVFTEVEIHWVNLLVGFLMASVAAAIVFGWFVRRASRPSARGWPTGLVFAVPREGLEVKVHQRVNVRVLELIDGESGAAIELEGPRLPGFHAGAVIDALHG